MTDQSDDLDARRDELSKIISAGLEAQDELMRSFRKVSYAFRCWRCGETWTVGQPDMFRKQTGRPARYCSKNCKQAAYRANKAIQREAEKARQAAQEAEWAAFRESGGVLPELDGIIELGPPET